eukprot:gene2895-3599_t
MGLGLIKGYLVLYNFVQCAGWMKILFDLTMHYVSGGTPDGVWNKVELLLVIFQGAAVLEIVHSAIGFVKTPIATTFVQVFSRVACVFLAYNVPTTQSHWVISLMLFSWSFTEVIRYSFYGLSILQSVPYFLGWLRYSTFIILYPSGVAGETGTIYVSMDYVKQTGFFSLAMPNSINFAFNTYYFLYFSFILYVLGLPWLYSHMLRQRKRFISGGSTSSKETVTKKQQ